ncbi:hypothetical protein GCM10020331_100630 [Ectobacillus funiculus]
MEFGQCHAISLYHVLLKNEIDQASAELLVSNGVKAIGEGANMPSTLEAVEVFLGKTMFYLPLLKRRMLAVFLYQH